MSINFIEKIDVMIWVLLKWNFKITKSKMSLQTHNVVFFFLIYLFLFISPYCCVFIWVNLQNSLHHILCFIFWIILNSQHQKIEKMIYLSQYKIKMSWISSYCPFNYVVAFSPSRSYAEYTKKVWKRKSNRQCTHFVQWGFFFT